MSMYLIASVTADGISQNNFTSIPQTFSHLQIRAYTRGINSSEYLFLRFNGESSNNYVSHDISGDGSSVTANSYASGVRTFITLPSVAGSSAIANNYGFAIIDILDYTNTSKNKTIKASGGFDNNGSGRISMHSGFWISTAAINQITIGSANNSDVSGAKFELYGITTNPLATGA